MNISARYLSRLKPFSKNLLEDTDFLPGISIYYEFLQPHPPGGDRLLHPRLGVLQRRSHDVKGVGRVVNDPEGQVVGPDADAGEMVV